MKSNSNNEQRMNTNTSRTNENIPKCLIEVFLKESEKRTKKKDFFIDDKAKDIEFYLLN